MEITTWEQAHEASVDLAVEIAKGLRRGDSGSVRRQEDRVNWVWISDDKETVVAFGPAEGEEGDPEALVDYTVWHWIGAGEPAWTDLGDTSDWDPRTTDCVRAASELVDLIATL